MGKSLKSWKKLLFSLLCLVLLSCAHQESVNPGACGSCDTLHSKEFKPEDAIKSMVLITGTAIQGEKKLGQWWGSGAVVGHNEKMGTLILTAGHVCVLSGLPPPKDGDAPITWTLDVTDKTETTYPAIVAFVVKDFDACLINVSLMDVPHLNLSESPPVVGERVSNISAPFAVFSKDLSLIFEGRYAGDLDIRKDLKVSAYTIPGAGGASGSPVLNAQGDIVGIVSQVNGYFHHITLSPMHEQLKVLFSGKAKVLHFDFAN